MESNQSIENNKTLKLNTKNTLYIGCAFFSILMLWQMYNNYCPLFLDYLLRKKYGESNEFIIGIIMAGDNALAIFMLPLFGSLSDKTNCKYGKRMPYIVIGMILSALFFPLIAIMFYIESLLGVIIMMAVILIIMNMYRNPAVALMPDVTPKPLRSKANGIINFVGYLGAILAGGLALFLKIAKDSSITNWEPTNKGNAILAFCIASFFMILAMLLLIFKINENKLLKENQEDIEYGEKLSETLGEVSENKPLSKADKKNFIVLLIGVLLWFMSFNAIETFNSLFCKKILGDEGIASTIVIILTISSILTFLLAANLPSKIGRKNTVLIGIAALAIGFVIILLYFFFNGVFNEEYHQLIEKNNNQLPFSVIPIYICIALCGTGWALINANSYPMMVEMSSRNNIGKYTGYYYTISMVAQTITPILVGIIMYKSESSLKLLYIYSAILMILAFLSMLFFKEKKHQKILSKKGLDALDVD